MIATILRACWATSVEASFHLRRAGLTLSREKNPASLLGVCSSQRGCRPRVSATQEGPLKIIPACNAVLDDRKNAAVICRIPFSTNILLPINVTTEAAMARFRGLLEELTSMVRNRRSRWPAGSLGGSPRSLQRIARSPLVNVHSASLSLR
nr:hypothetical protein CFP56_02623 [Quercus suber]